MKDALGHGLSVVPPILNASHSNWRPVPSLGIVAGWRQIPGIGEKTADRIDAVRWNEDGSSAHKFTGWSDLQQIPGIGPKTIENMEAFATAHDPFGLTKTQVTMDRVLDWIKDDPRIPTPTHNGTEIAAIYMENRDFTGKFVKGPRVVYAGIVLSREYKDIVEDTRSRTGREVADILKDLKSPHLIKSCSLRCYDKTDEEIYLRINRWKFPQLKKILERIAVNHDVVICIGNRMGGFGTPVMVEKIWVIDPN
jgi:DNA polymerase-3 subunit alpha